ncbi:MC family mitochondrial carrier protein [Geopyxis carbonaria]|nr:MC family mitochondrial carrier protein [Geopyxis carbonaria]
MPPPISSPERVEDPGPPPPPPNSPTSTPSSPSRQLRDNRQHSYFVSFLHDINATGIPDAMMDPISGATAGLISGVFTCPLDVIKTKLQAQGGWLRTHSRKHEGDGMRYRGLIGTTRVIWKDERLKGFYRGLGPLILGYLPTWMVYFTVYENSKRHLEGVFEEKWKAHILSSIIGGGVSTMCTNPIWVIKTRLMSQASSKASSSLLSSPYYYHTTIDAARKMYVHEGIRSFYSGLAPALLGLSHVAVQFPLYEYFKGIFTGGVELGKTSHDGSTPYLGIIASSCLSKICASTATYPHEVLRTRLQTQRIMNGHATKSGVTRNTTYPRYRGILHSVATIYREEGWRAFYAGMGTNMIRAVPSSAMTLLTYEVVKSGLKRIKEDSLGNP